MNDSKGIGNKTDIQTFTMKFITGAKERSGFACARQDCAAVVMGKWGRKAHTLPNSEESRKEFFIIFDFLKNFTVICFNIKKW